MSVDKTIEELSGTLAQLGVLVEHINAQIIGITSRINLTLDNFDHSVAGIATDAGLMTVQVGDTVSQIPNAWVFYLLFITVIVVLILLSILIVINLVARIHSIIRLIRGETSRTSTPVPSMIYSESKQPLNISYPGSPQIRDRLRHIAVPMETEPRRFGFGSQFAPMHSSGSGEFTLGTRAGYAQQVRSQEVPEPYISRRQPYQPSPTEFDVSPRRFNSENGEPQTMQREAVLLQAQQYQSTTTSQVPPFISPRAEAV